MSDSATEGLIGAELAEPGQRLIGVNRLVVSLLLVAGLLAACGGIDPLDATGSRVDPGEGEGTVAEVDLFEQPMDIPGLDPKEEIELVEVEPARSDDSFVWLRAFQVEGLPPVNVGHVTPEFLEDAHRQGADHEAYQCLGNASGSGGCGVEDDERPGISGLTFGGPDVRAWSWQFVPDDAVAIRFTDQDGQTSWQRPQERLVIFPDTVPNEPDDDCACQLDAINIDGAVIVSVDVRTWSYTND